MPGVCRNGTDSAGGALIASQNTVSANGDAIVVHGDNVTPHGVAPHGPAPPTMIAGSNNVFIGGIAVCNAGDLATCGHAASGSGDVSVG